MRAWDVVEIVKDADEWHGLAGFVTFIDDKEIGVKIQAADEVRYFALDEVLFVAGG